MMFPDSSLESCCIMHAYQYANYILIYWFARIFSFSRSVLLEIDEDTFCLFRFWFSASAWQTICYVHGEEKKLVLEKKVNANLFTVGICRIPLIYFQLYRCVGDCWYCVLFNKGNCWCLLSSNARLISRPRRSILLTSFCSFTHYTRIIGNCPSFIWYIGNENCHDVYVH